MCTLYIVHISNDAQTNEFLCTYKVQQQYGSMINVMVKNDHRRPKHDIQKYKRKQKQFPEKCICMVHRDSANENCEKKESKAFAKCMRMWNTRQWQAHKRTHKHIHPYMHTCPTRFEKRFSIITEQLRNCFPSVLAFFGCTIYLFMSFTCAPNAQKYRTKASWKATKEEEDAEETK